MNDYILKYEIWDTAGIIYLMKAKKDLDLWDKCITKEAKLQLLYMI